MRTLSEVYTRFSRDERIEVVMEMFRGMYASEEEAKERFDSWMEMREEIEMPRVEFEEITELARADPKPNLEYIGRDQNGTPHYDMVYPEYNICGYCAQRNRIDNLYCNHCGGPLDVSDSREQSRFFNVTWR